MEKQQQQQQQESGISMAFDNNKRSKPPSNAHVHAHTTHPSFPIVGVHLSRSLSFSPLLPVPVCRPRKGCSFAALKYASDFLAFCMRNTFVSLHIL